MQADKGDLWDSGKTASDESVNIEYAGQPLASVEDCFWKVRVWDQDAQVSSWSVPARWTIGLLHPADWQAKWIGYDGSAQRMTFPLVNLSKLMSFTNCMWVWTHGAKAGNQPPGIGNFAKYRHSRRSIVDSASFLASR